MNPVRITHVMRTGFYFIAMVMHAEDVKDAFNS